MTYLQPLYSCLIVALVLMAFSDRRFARSALRITAVCLLLLSWPPFVCLLLLPLERPYSRRAPSDSNVQAIVVLSSAVFPPTPPLPTPRLGSDTSERTVYAAWLYRNWRAVPVLASGGGANGVVPYSETMSEQLRKEGVDAERIWTETSSRSTYENAAFSAPVLRARGVRRIALVTEAYHMRRSELCFRKLGFEVVTAACGFRIPQHWTVVLTLPSWEGISWTEDIVHESLALAWYRVKGWI